MFKVGDRVRYTGKNYDGIGKEIGIVVGYKRGLNIVRYPNVKNENLHDCGMFGIKEYLLVWDGNLKLIGDDNMKIKVGSKVEYVGEKYDVLLDIEGTIQKIDGEYALVYFPDLLEHTEIYDGEYLHNDLGKYTKNSYAWIYLEDLILIDNGGDSMKKIIVTGNTGDYHRLPMGTMLDVISEEFGYVNTPSGSIKDIDYVVYSDKMLVKIMDLRDIIKATNAKFKDDEGLYYPDGKLLLSGKNQEHIGKTFNVLKITDKQIVIGNPKVRICFGKSEIGKAIKLIQG